MNNHSSQVLERLLRTAQREADRQRSALLRQDLPELRRSFDALAALLVECHELASAGPASAEIRDLAREVREQLRLNQGLLHNGGVAVDQWVAALAAAAPASGSVLFSEVG